MISIIVPYYNSSPWLGRCCQSLTENEGDFEFVMVNDSSEDDGEDIAREYNTRDCRFFLINNRNKKGVSGARNTGIEYAAGDWITFLDADDRLAPNAFSVFNEAIRNGSYNIYQFNHWRYYSKIDKMSLKYTNEPGLYGFEDRPLLFCMVWNKLYKAEFLKSIRFDESVKYCEDELFNLECIARDNRICCLDGETSIHYFDNEHSLTKTKTAKDLFLQMEKLTALLKRQQDPTIKTALCNYIGELWTSNVYLDIIGERQRIGGGK